VREATRYLLETTIPAFARWLDEQHVLNESSPDVLLGSHAGKIDIEAQLTELLHMEGTRLTIIVLHTHDTHDTHDTLSTVLRAGINCRYLGRVCNVVKCKKVKKIIIHEMLGRVVKNKLRARLRDVNSTSELTQNVYRKCVLEFLNLLLGQDQLMVRCTELHCTALHCTALHCNPSLRLLCACRACHACRALIRRGI
jgi:hypothetical protein